MKRFFMAAAGLLFVAGCAGGPTPIPEQNSAPAALYTKRCSVCHSLPHPRRLSAAVWTQTVERMQKEMEQKKMAPLAPEEKEVILDYLRKNAR